MVSRGCQEGAKNMSRRCQEGFSNTSKGCQEGVKTQTTKFRATAVVEIGRVDDNERTDEAKILEDDFNSIPGRREQPNQ